MGMLKVPLFLGSAFCILAILSLAGRHTPSYAQSQFPTAYLRQAVPKPPIGPTSPVQCDTLNHQWTQYQQAISNAHSQCIQQQSRIKGARPSRRNCQFAACDDIHDLMVDGQVNAGRNQQVQACRDGVQQHRERQRQVEQYQRKQQEALDRKREEITKQFREQYPERRYSYEDRMDMRARQEAERQVLGSRLEELDKRNQTLNELSRQAYELAIRAKEREDSIRGSSRDLKGSSPTEKAVTEATETAVREKAEKLAVKSMGVENPLDGARQAFQQSAKNAFEEVMGKRMAEQVGRVSKFLAKHGTKLTMIGNVTGIVMDPIRTSEFDAWLDVNPEAVQESHDRAEQAQDKEHRTRQDFKDRDRHMRQYESAPRFGPGCTSTLPCLQRIPSATAAQHPIVEIPTAQRYWGRSDAMTWALDNRLSGIPTPFEDPNNGEAGFVVKRGEEWKSDERSASTKKCSKFNVVLLDDNGEASRRYLEEWCR